MNEPNFQATRIAVILGTSRPNSYTSKVLLTIIDELKISNVHFDLIDPSKLSLLWPGIDGNERDVLKIKDICSQADGIIFSTPEYHGSMSACAKLIIENLGFPSVLAGKPMVILGVATGSAGAIKSLEQLRCVLSHIGAIVLPGPVSVASVDNVFDSDGLCRDPIIEKRLRELVGILMHYIDP